MKIRRLWQRYNPRRKYVDLDDDVIAMLSQLGYVELYRGEWFFTDAGIAFLEDTVDFIEKEIINDSR